jgi:hypothetical protein
MDLPGNDHLKARFPTENVVHKQRLDNLKTALNLAYKQVAKANKQSHESNKQRYDRRVKLRRLELKEMVFLYNPAVKKGLTRKFNRPWHGPYQITKRISELNYEDNGQKR